MTDQLKPKAWLIDDRLHCTGIEVACDERADVIEYWKEEGKATPLYAIPAGFSLVPADLAEQFSVIAGKHDGQDLNCKYSENFGTLDQAIAAYDKMSGYPWAYIEYKGRIIEVWKEGNNPLREE